MGGAVPEPTNPHYQLPVFENRCQAPGVCRGKPTPGTPERPRAFVMGSRRILSWVFDLLLTKARTLSAVGQFPFAQLLLWSRAFCSTLPITTRGTPGPGRGGAGTWHPEESSPSYEALLLFSFRFLLWSGSWVLAGVTSPGETMAPLSGLPAGSDTNSVPEKTSTPLLPVCDPYNRKYLQLLIPITSYQLLIPITGPSYCSLLPFTSYQLPVTSYQLPVTNPYYELPVTNC